MRFKESFQEHLEYSVLEFTDCPEVGQDEFQESITSINEGVESLIIKDTLWINDDILELFTAFCHKIKSLRLEGIFPHVTRLGIESVGRNCSNLESLSVISSQSNNKNDGGGNKDAENCEILRWNLDNQIFTALVNSSSAKLKSFTLCGFNTFTSDRLLSLLNHFKDTLVMLDFSCLTCIENNALKELGKICPNIVCLRLNQCKGVQDEGLISLSSTCRCLENLELQGCCRITDDSIVALTRNCVSLTQINLKGCTLLTDISLRAIARNCKRLSHVNMSETRVEKVPNDIGRLDNLTSLNLSDCKELVYPSPNIISNGVDAIRLKLLESDISRRVRVFFIGNQQSGKTSIILSLESTSASVADGETFGIPVTTWFPFRHVSSDGK